MTFLPGDLGIRKLLLDILKDLPDGKGRRQAILRLLWDHAAGVIIGSHATIKRCHPDGRLLLEVDDPRWIPELRNSSGIIIERINRMLTAIACSEYSVLGFDIYNTPQRPPEKRKSGPEKKIVIPPEILENAQKLPADIRARFLEWYEVVRKNQSEN